MALADRLRHLDLPGRVAPPENWHLTLRFLGLVATTAYERFVSSLDRADLGAPFRVGLHGLGAFPRPGRATVVWVAVGKGEDRLEELARIGEEAAQAAGIDPEERPFRAHLTLSRVRPPVDVSALVEAVPELGLEWTCDEVVVYRSHLGRGGARYEPLETFALTR